MSRIPLPSLSAVRAFEATARLGSFTLAAAELNLTQAGVSYQIRQLEQRLGLLLFRRMSRRIELTPAGCQIAPMVIQAFGTLNAAFSLLAEVTHHELSITSSPTIGASWLAPRLGAFQLANTDLSVRLDTSIELKELGDEFNVAIRNGTGEWPGLRSHKLLPYLFTPLCSPHLRVHGRPLGHIHDLALVPIRGHQAWWRQWLEEVGSPVDLPGRIGPAFDIEQLDVVAAMAGHGVAIASPIFFAEELRSGALVQPFEHVSVHRSRDFWLCYPKGLRQNRKVIRLRDFLLAEAKVAQEAFGPVVARSKVPAPE